MSFADVVRDDPYLSMPKEQRIALRRQRREKFRPRQLANPVVRFKPYFPVILDPADLLPKHEKDLIADWVKRQKETGYCQIKPLKKIVTSDIQRAVAAEFDIPLEFMFNASRLGRVVLPRQIAMYLTRKIIRISSGEIGRRFGGRDHATALHAVRKIQKMMDADPLFEAGVNRLRAAIVEKRG